MSALLAWAARQLTSGTPGRQTSVPADAYPLDAVGWGTGGWPWM